MVKRNPGKDQEWDDRRAKGGTLTVPSVQGGGGPGPLQQAAKGFALNKAGNWFNTNIGSKVLPETMTKGSSFFTPTSTYATALNPMTYMQPAMTGISNALGGGMMGTIGSAFLPIGLGFGLGKMLNWWNAGTTNVQDRANMMKNIRMRGPLAYKHGTHSVPDTRKVQYYEPGTTEVTAPLGDPSNTITGVGYTDPSQMNTQITPKSLEKIGIVPWSSNNPRPSFDAPDWMAWNEKQSEDAKLVKRVQELFQKNADMKYTPEGLTNKLRPSQKEFANSLNEIYMKLLGNKGSLNPGLRAELISLAGYPQMAGAESQVEDGKLPRREPITSETTEAVPMPTVPSSPDNDMVPAELFPGEEVIPLNPVQKTPGSLGPMYQKGAASTSSPTLTPPDPMESVQRSYAGPPGFENGIVNVQNYSQPDAYAVPGKFTQADYLPNLKGTDRGMSAIIGHEEFKKNPPYLTIKPPTGEDFSHLYQGGPLNKKQREMASFNKDMKIKDEKIKQEEIKTKAAINALHNG